VAEEEGKKKRERIDGDNIKWSVQTAVRDF